MSRVLFTTFCVLCCCCCVAVVAHPATSPLAAGAAAAGLIFALGFCAAGGLAVGAMVYRITRKAAETVNARGLDPKAAQAAFPAELAAAYADSRLVVASVFAWLGVGLHAAAAQVAGLAGLPQEDVARFTPASFLVGLIVGVCVHAARRRARTNV